MSGLGNNKGGVIKSNVELKVKSVLSSDNVSMLAHIFNNLTYKLPCAQVTINYWVEIKNLPLAAKKFDTPKDIDILVRFDYFFSLIREGKIIRDVNLLAENTVCSCCTMHESITVCHLSQSVTEEDLNKTLRL